MEIYKGIKPLLKKIDRLKKIDSSIGLVPTMGYLHEGHLSLIRKAREDTDCVTVSIFVNPMQFGPKEDFKQYPRDSRRDLRLCRRQGVDIVFMPSEKEMYGEAFCTYVNVENLTDRLCGASRPGHFKGVTTVVAKLFNIIQPDVAYFGQKDAQQAIVIKRMVEDLNMPLKIKIMPIMRDKDGLALSSRNVYLSHEERRQALSIYQSLKLARDLFRRGERNSKNIIEAMRQLFSRQRNFKIDYISIVDFDDLKDVNKISGKALVTVAVIVGKTRLIDNIILN